MPPTSLIKDLSKLKHPNSRKTKQLARKAKRFNNRSKIKLGHALKSNILGEKFSWFTDEMEPFLEQDCLTPKQFMDIMDAYLTRFDDEIEQINIKQSISKNRSKQHASRMDVIRINLERDTGEYNGAGIELMNLCDPKKFKEFISWDGDSVNLQHFKLERISRKFLQNLEEANKME